MSKLPAPLTDFPFPVIGPCSSSAPPTRHCPVQGRGGGLHARAQRAPSRSAGGLAEGNHRDAGGLQRGPPRRTGRPVCHQPDRAQEQRPSGARHGVVCEIQGADHHHVVLGRARTSTPPPTATAVWCCTTSSTTSLRTKPSRRADGLIAVAAGAGGHAGSSTRLRWCKRFASGSMVRWPCRAPLLRATPSLAAQACGADFAYIGSPFIATTEARASEAYKQAIVDCNSDDIVYSNLFTGVHGNYLAPSIRNAGLDPSICPKRPQQDELWRKRRGQRPGRTSGVAAGGIGAIDKVQSAGVHRPA